jgi:hypothetical protein
MALSLLQRMQEALLFAVPNKGIIVKSRDDRGWLYVCAGVRYALLQNQAGGSRQPR